jgi:hypothetical protein
VDALIQNLAVLEPDVASNLVHSLVVALELNTIATLDSSKPEDTESGQLHVEFTRNCSIEHCHGYVSHIS